MNKKPLLAILGTTLLFSVGKVSVSYAQEQGTEPAVSKTASEKDNPSSKTDVSAEANAVRKTSQGPQTGLGGRFIGDRGEICTRPTKLPFSDTHCLVAA